MLIKAVGLICLMAQSGIIPPLGPQSALPVFDAVFADIGDRQSIAASLSTFSAHVAALRDRYRGRAPIRVFVQIDDVPLYTVGGPHLITEILGLCGGENVFAEASAQALQVDLESVLARAPDVILSTDAGEPGPSWQRFSRIPAVAEGNVYRSRADLLARPSPRIAEGAADVCARLDEARAKQDQGNKGDGHL